MWTVPVASWTLGVLVVGEHDGIHAFTIGQRKGLGISSPEPRYVLELRPDRQHRGGRRPSGCHRTDAELLAPLLHRVAARRHLPGVDQDPLPDADRPGIVELTSSDSAQVEFEKPVWGVAPGQLAVFYDGDRVIGGGTIDAGKAAA